MKHLALLFSALLISMSSMAQMYLWQGGQPTNADIDSITFTGQKADNTFTILENTLSMYEGETYTLNLLDNLYPANKYRWQSGNTRVATVGANGSITARHAGMTLITATYGTRTQMCILTVREVVRSLTTDPVEAVMYVDSTLQLTAVVKPTNAKVTWESEDNNVATVDANGLVTAKAAGEVQIYAVWGTLRAAAKITIFNNPVTCELALLEVKQKKCTVAITPSYEEGYYYCGYADAATMEGMSDSELTENVLANIQQNIEYYTSQGYSVTMKDFLQQGTKNLTASGMTASTDYVMCAFGIDVDNEKASPIVTRLPFRTADVVSSSMEITLQYDSVIYVAGKTKVDTIVYFSAHPSNDKETYLLGGAEKGYLTEKFNGDPAVYMQNMEASYDKKGTLEKYLRTGVNKIYASNPADGSQWVIIAAGYDGGFTTKMFTYEYTYVAPKDGKPARLVPNTVVEDSTAEQNAIQILPLEELDVQHTPALPQQPAIPGMCH